MASGCSVAQEVTERLQQPAFWGTALPDPRVLHCAFPVNRVLFSIRAQSPALENSTPIQDVHLTRSPHAGAVSESASALISSGMRSSARLWPSLARAQGKHVD